MRFAHLTLLSLALLITGCYLPREWKTANYDVDCAPIDKAPPDNADLFITLRLPHCIEDRVELTSFRARQPWYAAHTSIDGQPRVVLYSERAWRNELQRRVEQTGKMPVLFIHGYNNGNAEALRRARLIAWALKARYPVVSLTWPSYDKLDSYFWDEANNEWASDSASEIVSNLAAAYPGTIIVAHSMGNRLALAALTRLELNGQSANVAKLIMAAPDIDRDAAARRLRAGLGVDVTMYASLRDQPLSGSWRAHGYPRAGDFSFWVTGQRPQYAFAQIPWVEVIDTTGVDKSSLGHAAFIETPEGAADLCRVINGQPATRLGVRHQPDEPANYGHLARTSIQDDCTWSPPH